MATRRFAAVALLALLGMASAQNANGGYPTPENVVSAAAALASKAAKHPDVVADTLQGHGIGVVADKTSLTGGRHAFLQEALGASGILFGAADISGTAGPTDR
jgi:hypothetical protein